MQKGDNSQEEFGATPQDRPVPRISIHAFCEFPDTGAALQRAGADRRLSKAHLTVQLGGIAAAMEFYRDQVTPNLLIVETRLSGQAALDELDHLAEVVPRKSSPRQTGGDRFSVTDDLHSFLGHQVYGLIQRSVLKPVQDG